MTGSGRRGDAGQPFRPLLISGPPRSGTTLVYSLFDGHPDIFSLVTEGYLFEYLHDLPDSGVAAFIDAGRLPAAEFVAGLRAKDVMPPLHRPVRLGTTNPAIAKETATLDWSEDRFLAALDVGRAASVGELWYGLARAYAAALGRPPARYCSMKAPDYGKSAMAATSHIAEAKAIVVVREPIRALDSLKRVREMRGLREKLLTWPVLAQCVAEMNALAERLHRADPDRVTWLRFEDLTARPEATMRRIAAWCGLDFQPSLTRPSVLGRDIPSNSSFEAVLDIQDSVATRGVRRLSAGEIDFACRNLGRFLNFFGYAPAHADVP